MRRFVHITTFFIFALSVLVSASYGQEKNSPRPDVEMKVEGPNAPKPKKVVKSKSFELAKDLDGLFAQLKRTGDRKLSKEISTRIWAKWQTSDSKSVDLLTHWAREATGDNRYGQALDLLDQVIVLRPDYAEGYNQRATLHYQMQNFGKSVVDIERTLALEPRHFGALAGLASILERLGKKDKALATWYRALDVYPAMRSAQNAVVRLEEDLAGNGI